MSKFTVHIPFLSVFLIFLGLTACQNTAKQECEDKNWRQQAYLDALNGLPLNRFQKVQDQCQKFNVEIQSEIYKEGYDLGLVKLCTRQQGFEFGLKGREYYGTCKERDEEGFLKAYRSGRLQYLKKVHAQLYKDIQESEGRVWRKQNEYELEANSNPQAAKEVYDILESYRAELTKLQQEYADVKTRIDELSRLIN